MKDLLAWLAAVVPPIATSRAPAKERPGDLPVEHGAQTMLLDANGGDHGTASAHLHP